MAKFEEWNTATFSIKILYFPEIETDILTYSSNARGLKLGHSGIFNMLFSFLAFFKLHPILNNVFRKIVVMCPQLQRAYCYRQLIFTFFP